MNRAVNEEGWEYATDDQDGVWCPAEKTIHACRRKRWVRMRKCIEEPEQVEVCMSRTHIDSFIDAPVWSYQLQIMCSCVVNFYVLYTVRSRLFSPQITGFLTIRTISC